MCIRDRHWKFWLLWLSNWQMIVSAALGGMPYAVPLVRWKAYSAALENLVAATAPVLAPWTSITRYTFVPSADIQAYTSVTSTVSSAITPGPSRWSAAFANGDSSAAPSTPN